MRNSSLDKFSVDREKEEKNNNYAYEGRHKETNLSRPELSVLLSRLKDFLCIIRGTGSLSNQKSDCWQICKLEKFVSNSLFINIIFKT